MELAELMRKASPFSGMQMDLLAQEQRTRDLVDPPALRWLRESEEHLRRAAEAESWTRCFREAEAQAQRIRELISPSPLMAQLQELAQSRLGALEACSSPITEFSRTLARSDEFGAVYSRIHEAVLSRVQALQPACTAAEIAASKIPDIGSAVAEIARQTCISVTQMLPLSTADYSAVAAGFDQYISNVGLTQSSIFTGLPERELFVSADWLSALTGNILSRGDIELEPRTIRRRIDLYIYETLDEALTDLAPSLLSALAGARQAAMSRNPDKIRHACVSLRTVSLDILELLAPTDEVEKWSSRPRDFYNGKPRSLTRLRFISHRIASPELAKFMEADSHAVCQLLDVLHEGTHEVGVEMNLRQLRYLFRRVESFLCAIVEATLSD